MSDRITCAKCGHSNSTHRTTCKKCRVNLEQAFSEYEGIDPTSVANPSDYEYLVVPFVGQLQSGNFSGQKASQQLQQVINKHARAGWDFYSIDEINIRVTPGCLAGLLGAKASFVTLDQIIFRRKRVVEDQ